MSWKNKALDSNTDKLQTAKENVALVVAEKDRQSLELISFQRANKDLKAQLRDFDRRMKESKSRCKVAEEKVGYYKFAEYTTKVVDIYKSSPEFEEFSMNFNSYDRGCVHILRQLHQYIPDKPLMCRAYKGSFADPKFRGGCSFALFTESELEEIAAANQKAGGIGVRRHQCHLLWRSCVTNYEVHR